MDFLRVLWPGAYLSVSTLGGTVGITIGEAIISSTLLQKLRGIQGLTIDTSAAALNDSVRQIASIPVRDPFHLLLWFWPHVGLLHRILR